MSVHGLVVKQEETILAPTSHPAPIGQAHQATPFACLRNARRRRAILWGIVSTVLSAIGLVGLALFEQYNGMLSELRADLKHFNETSADYVKKDRMQHVRDEMKECFRELESSKLAREQLERELKASEKTREDVVKEMQLLRERLAYVEGLRAAAPPAGGKADGTIK
jgi:hypothetical protein